MTLRKMKLVNSVKFNQEHACFVCCEHDGFRIFNVEPLMQLLHVRNEQIGCSGVLRADLLRRTNIVAFIPTGCDNVVKIWDGLAGKVRQEISFHQTALDVRFHHDRLIVVLGSHIFTFSILPEIAKLSKHDTRQNTFALCAIGGPPEAQSIAFPGLGKLGTVQVVNLSLAEANCTVAPVTIPAHEHELACLAINAEGNRMATASRHGTLVRVFCLRKREKLMELRRGADTALVYNLSFSADMSFLCAVSDKGTVHIFAILDSGLNRRSTLHKMGGLVSAYTDSQWGVTSFTIPAEMACICTFLNRNAVVAICVDGTYHKYIFKPEGGCNRDAFDRYLELGDNMEM